MIGWGGLVSPRQPRTLGIFASLLVLAAASCIRTGPAIPSTVYAPDLVGPIEALEPAPNGASDVVVRDRTIRVSSERPRALSSGLAIGALFIYGEEEGGDAWYMTIGRVSTGELSGCFGLSTQPVVEDGTHLIFRVTEGEGVRLPKAADLELPAPDPETGVYPFPGATYCLEADGTVSGSELP